MDDYEQIKKKIEPTGHSNWIYQTYNEEVIYMEGDACYYEVFDEERDLVKLCIFTPIEGVSEVGLNFLHWLVEESEVSSAFLTKVEEGVEHGFEINVKQPGLLVKAALLSFRFPLEFPTMCESWWEFKQKGLSNVEAYAAAHHFYFNKGKLCKVMCDWVHTPFTSGCCVEAYSLYGLDVLSSGPFFDYNSRLYYNTNVGNLLEIRGGTSVVDMMKQKGML